MKVRVCKDCIASGEAGPLFPVKRPAPHPGPRCATHWRVERVAQRQRRHENRVTRVYGLPEKGYEALRASQGGRCAIQGCRARGLRRALSVDHDHETGEVRGLLCSTHNEWIGRAHDDPSVFESIAAYLRNPPAREVLERLKES